MDHLSLRRALTRAGRELYRQGMMAGAAGNLSVRLSAEEFLITPSGAPKGRLKPGDLLVVDGDGRVLHGEGRPSAETAMHLAIYRRHAHVGAVVHAHPLKAGALAAAHRPIDISALPEAILVLGDLPCLPFIPSGTPELGEAVARALDQADGALLFNHGAVTVGPQIERAQGRMEILEALAETTLLTAPLGGGVALPQAELERLRMIWRERRG